MHEWIRNVTLLPVNKLHYKLTISIEWISSIVKLVYLYTLMYT